MDNAGAVYFFQGGSLILVVLAFSWRQEPAGH